MAAAAEHAENEVAAAAAQVLGYLGTMCFALLLAPQIALNQERQSTDGFSLLLVLLWHASAVLYLPYLVQKSGPVPLVVQWIVFTGTCRGMRQGMVARRRGLTHRPLGFVVFPSMAS